ncbi:MAG TPA: SCO family protein [Spirochaetia bacterium]|nr:SCO family protein [Spirochaetia bacterium]
MKSLSPLLLILPLALLAAAPLRAAPPAALKGNIFSQPWIASDFMLTDQHGKPFRMADTKGKVVVLTYIYTHCTDFCPFVALKLKEAGKLVGADEGRLVLVAVSTDPERDTPQVCAEYSKAIGMFDSWHFVTGRRAAVKKVWKDYFIGVEKEEEKPAAAPAKPSTPQEEKEARDEAEKVARGLSAEDTALVGQIIDMFGGGYDVSHDIPFWIVDKQGRMRVSLDADATPADIALDVRSLLAE